MMTPYPLTEKLVLPLTTGVASSRTLTDRRFVSATRYSTRRHDKAAIKKGLRVSTQTPPEHKPKHREQPLPKLVWAQSRKEANRIVHALNGNVHMIGSPKTTTASGSWATTGSRGDKRYQNVCLVDSLRSLGVKLQYTADGPFWALSDGNAMLSAFGKVLRPADKKDLTKIGKYIIYGNGHFVGVEVFPDGTFLYPSCRRHISMEVCVERFDGPHRSMPKLRVDAIESVFQLFDVPAACSD